MCWPRKTHGYIGRRTLRMRERGGHHAWVSSHASHVWIFTHLRSQRFVYHPKRRSKIVFLFHDDANLSKFRKILRNGPRPVIFVEEGRILRSGKKTRVLSLIFEFYGEKKIIRCINSVTNTTTISGNDHLSSENSRPRDIESRINLVTAVNMTANRESERLFAWKWRHALSRDIFISTSDLPECDKRHQVILSLTWIDLNPDSLILFRPPISFSSNFNWTIVHFNRYIKYRCY